MNITRSEQLDGPSEGELIVEDGGALVIRGVHEGSVDVQPGGHVDVHGVVRGRVTVGSLGTVLVFGDIVGAVDIRVAGTLVIEPSGRISGDVNNFGSFTNRGLRAGHVAGRTPDDQGDGVRVEPPHVGGARYQLPERG